MVSEDQGHKRRNTPSNIFLFPSEAESEHEKHERHYLDLALTNGAKVSRIPCPSIHYVLHAQAGVMWQSRLFEQQTL
jgi:hypothetical protein